MFLKSISSAKSLSFAIVERLHELGVETGEELLLLAILNNKLIKGIFRYLS